MKKYLILVLFLSIYINIFCVNTDLMISEGIEAFQIEDYEKAQDIFNKVIVQEPRRGEAYYYLGIIDKIRGELGSAELNLSKAVEIDPKWSSAYERLAQVALLRSDEEKARNYYQKALKFNNNSQEALKFFGDYFYEQKEFEKSKKLFLRLKSLSGVDKDVAYKLGFLFLSEKDYDKALSYFSVYSGLSPFDNDVKNRVFLLKFLLNSESPEDLKEKAESILKEQDIAHKNVKLLFINTKKILDRTEKITENTKKEIQKRHENSTIVGFLVNNMVSILFSLIFGLLSITGIYFAYKKYFSEFKHKIKQDNINKKNLEKAENDEPALKKLFKQAQKENDIKNQINIILKLIELNPTAEYYHSLAIVHEINGNNEEAINALEKAGEKEKGDDKLHTFMDIIRIMLKLNMFTQASTKLDTLKKYGIININIFIKKLEDFPNNLYLDLNFFSSVLEVLEKHKKNGKVIKYLRHFIEYSDDQFQIESQELKLIKYLKFEKLFNEAASIYLKLIEKYPEKLELYYGIVETYIALKDVKRALVYMKTIFKGFPDKKKEFLDNCMGFIDEFPENEELYTVLIDISSKNEDLSEYTQKIFKKYIENFNTENILYKYYNFLKVTKPNAAFDLIDEFLKKEWKKYYNNFLEDLNAYLNKNSGDIDRIFQLANMLKNIGRNSEAFILYKKINEIKPGNYQILIELFKLAVFLERSEEIYSLGKDLLETEESMQKALELLENFENKDKKIRKLEIDMYIKDKNLNKAVENFRFYEIKYPEDIKSLFEFARILKKVNIKDALDKFKKLLQLDNDNVEYWHEVGDIFEKSGNIKQALKAYTKLLSFGKTDEKFIAAVEFYLRNGFFDLALDSYGKIENKREREEIKKNIYMEKSRFEFKILNQVLNGGSIPEESQNHMIRGKNVKVSITRSLLNLKNTNDKYIINSEMVEKYYYMDVIDEGIELAQELLKKKENWKVRYFLGKLFIEKGLVEIAFNEFKTINWRESGLDVSEQSEYLYDIAKVFEERHMEKESIEFYRDIFARDMNFKDVKSKIEELDNKLLMSKTIDETTGLSLEIRRRYTDIEELGKGGMGIVYKAKDKKLGRTVALKVMHSEFVNNKSAVERFLKEARAIATLNHPNIIGIFDVNSDKNVYIAMEYVEGRNLKQLLSVEKEIPTEKVLSISEKVCDAIAAAHNKGVIHRDIKPENIMIDKNSVVKLMDFGLAVTGNANTNEIMGTPFFMSPEQIRGENVDNRTDIYSFGVTMYQLLTGKLPFGDGDVKERHLTENALNPSSINKKLPIEIDGVILKCLSKEPEKRYSSMEELKKDILSLKKIL